MTDLIETCFTQREACLIIEQLQPLPCVSLLRVVCCTKYFLARAASMNGRFTVLILTYNNCITPVSKIQVEHPL